MKTAPRRGTGETRDAGPGAAAKAVNSREAAVRALQEHQHQLHAIRIHEAVLNAERKLSMRQLCGATTSESARVANAISYKLPKLWSAAPDDNGALDCVGKREPADERGNAINLALQRELMKSQAYFQPHVTFPKIRSCPKPMSVLSVSDSKESRKQMWCNEYRAFGHGTQDRANIATPNTSATFANIEMPPQRHKQVPATDPIHFTARKVPFARGAEPSRLASRRGGSEDAMADSEIEDGSISRSEVAPTKPSLPYVHPFVKIEMLKNRRRPHPTPKRAGVSMEEIMQDMQQALNNLFFYPSYVPAHDGTAEAAPPQDSHSRNPTKKFSRPARKHAKTPRFYDYVGDSSRKPRTNFFREKAQREYNYCHLKKEDYATPLSMTDVKLVSDVNHEIRLSGYHFTDKLPTMENLRSDEVIHAKAVQEKKSKAASCDQQPCSDLVEVDVPKNDLVLIGKGNSSAAKS
ncbi:hypothetical protein HDU83_009710 [Entophlyctis luteolus]|nr:hypothetical protein HDU83_009710 [Entophlyctis luteolus]